MASLLVLVEGFRVLSKRGNDPMAEKKIEGMTHLINCPKCGGSNPPDARHCSVCGTALAGKTETKPVAQPKKGGIFSKLFGKPK